MKAFIITIDTEGDNLWSWKKGDPITTENVKYLPRFQRLCDSYGFKPVWLTDYEMIMDPAYAAFIDRVEANGSGELGAHLHAWSTPPAYELRTEEAGAPYLIEYPDSVMEEKLACLTETIKKRTGITPVTHRAGRWAMDGRYFALLRRYGYRVDCSVTPGEDWSGHKGATVGSGGSDYTKAPSAPYWTDADQTLLEVPLSTVRTHRFFRPEKLAARKLAGSLKRAALGENIWLRPRHSGEPQIRYLIERVRRSDADYLMFMLHSSELMPGGSPNFRTEESIEALYRELDGLFQIIARDFRGMTLRGYCQRVLEEADA